MLFIYIYLLKHESLWKHWTQEHREFWKVQSDPKLPFELACRYCFRICSFKLGAMVTTCQFALVFILEINIYIYIYMSVYILICACNLNPPNHLVFLPSFQVFLLAETPEIWSSWYPPGTSRFLLISQIRRSRCWEKTAVENSLENSHVNFRFGKRT